MQPSASPATPKAAAAGSYVRYPPSLNADEVPANLSVSLSVTVTADSCHIDKGWWFSVSFFFFLSYRTKGFLARYLLPEGSAHCLIHSPGTGSLRHSPVPGHSCSSPGAASAAKVSLWCRLHGVKPLFGLKKEKKVLNPRIRDLVSIERRKIIRASSSRGVAALLLGSRASPSGLKQTRREWHGQSSPT